MTVRAIVAPVALAALVTLLEAAQPSPAVAQEPSAWKPFQELNFLVGSWSGTAESGGRVGGRVGRWSLEMGGNYLVHRGNTIIPAQGGQPEESTEEVGYYVYDREKRKYVAHYYYSTGITATYDVDFPAEGTVRIVSSQVLNYEAGARLRMTLSRKAEEVTFQMDVAAGGKDFASYVSSKMTKK